MSGSQQEDIVPTLADMLQWLNDHARQGVFTTDRALKILSWNRWLEERSNRPAQDVIGKPLTLVLPEIVQRNLFASYETALTGASSVVAQRFHEYLIAMPPPVWHSQVLNMQQSATVSPLLRGSAVVGTITVIEDVTERVVQERALQASEERFRLIATAASDRVWDWNLGSGTIWSLDPVSGESGRELGVDDWWRLTAHDEDLVEARRSLDDALASPKAFWTHEHRAPDSGRQSRYVLNRAWLTRSASGRAERVLGAIIDLTESRKREDHIKFLLRELSHRSKNLLAVIQSMSSQTARMTNDLAEHQHRFLARLRALATSHELLTSNDWQGAPLDLLLERTVEPFRDLTSRFSISGPAVRLQPQAAQCIGLALHELATNAAKYGSLSSPSGSVKIDWSIVEGATFHMQWREFGGPPVVEPARKGFGHVVINRMTAQTLTATADLKFWPEGVVWTIEAPLDSVVA